LGGLEVLGIAGCRRLGLLLEPCLAEDVLCTAPELQREYKLLTNDSIGLDCALRIGADCLVTADRAFAGVSRIRTVILDDLA
jgi:predicted nucleic acid-binding protein